MAAATVTERRSSVAGNVRIVTAKVVVANADDDIATGLSYVVGASLSGVSTTDHDISIARNASATTTEGGTPGSIHLEGATAGTYRLLAIGT